MAAVDPDFGIWVAALDILVFVVALPDFGIWVAVVDRIWVAAVDSDSDFGIWVAAVDLVFQSNSFLSVSLRFVFDSVLKPSIQQQYLYAFV